MNISIIGTGYLGLTTGAVLAASGHTVYCVDINPEVIEKVKAGIPHFYEPGLEELVKEQVLNTKRLIPTLDYTEAIPNSDISFICVDTPSDEDGNLSTRAAEAASKTIAKNMNDEHIIVMKSTVPVGTEIKIKNLIKETTSTNFYYASNPEFLSEGASVIMTFLPDHLVIGSDNDEIFNKIYSLFEQVDEYARENVDLSLNTINETYRSKFDFKKPFKERVVRTSIPSAELIKVTANSFLAMKISFANAIARVADKTGANVNEVMTGIGADPRIGRDFLYAGLGWGGGCFPKDVKGLIKNAKDVGFDFNLLKEVENINEEQVEYVSEKAQKIFNKETKNKTVSVLGLSFKPGTNDIRVSPSIRLVRELSNYFHTVKVFDPKANNEAKEELNELDNIVYAQSVKEVSEKSDLIILATDWPEFITLDLSTIKNLVNSPNILDARNRWNQNKIESLGFNYSGIGV